jgi:hypothetical protein
MRSLLLTGIAAFAGLAAGTNAMAVGLFASTGPVIAILAGDRFQGTAEGHLDGSGTVLIESQATPGLTCRGSFTSSAELGGMGSLRCTDGLVVTFQFRRLTLRRGYGTGTSSRGPLNFTYGLSPAESAQYLKAPPT